MKIKNQTTSENKKSALTKKNIKLDYWRMLNTKTSQYESITSMATWTEADKIGPCGDQQGDQD
jgi:hypothetical protein